MISSPRKRKGFIIDTNVEPLDTRRDGVFGRDSRSLSLPRATALQNVEMPLVYAGVPAERRMHRARQVLERSRRGLFGPRRA